MTLQRLENMVAELAQHEQDFKVDYKEESSLMKVIGKLIFFNSDFMTKYTTVLGGTVYFPTRSNVEENPRSKLVTIAHEYQHVKDSSRLSSILFMALYALPQLLAPFMLFFCFLHWWLGLLLFALFLAPLPAYGRMIIERRGYVMSLFVANELLVERSIDSATRKEILINRANQYNKEFTSSAYYFMWPFGVKKHLHQAVDKIVAEQMVTTSDTFIEVKSALAQSNK